MKKLFRGSFILTIIIVGSIVFLGTTPMSSDEGMWTFDNPPIKQLKERYGFTPTQEWLDHIRLSSVRINDGGSGSFISPTGLVLTNHHVALGQLQKISNQQKNYVRDGFYAATAADELKCPDLELNVLVNMKNVTGEVAKSIKTTMSEKEAFEARKAAIAKIEKESTDNSGLRSDVVNLYEGGEYWLYQYKKYTDVRLVFAPEDQIAFYGGDPDNFTYPRYDLDLAIFRVYENNKPIHQKEYLKWNEKGAADGELVFVSGHPGSTDRLTTYAELESQRDNVYPFRIISLKHRVELLKKYSSQGSEQARQAASQIFYFENSIKAMEGEYRGLRDKDIMTKKKADEDSFRKLVSGNSKWQKAYGDAWNIIEQRLEKQQENLKAYRYRALRNSRLAGIAQSLVRFVAEIKKPDGERLEGYHDSQLESLKYRLFSPAPFYPELEEMTLSDALQESLEQLGPDDPFIKKVIGSKNPVEVAKELIEGTKLADPNIRKQLADGGEKAIMESSDPMIVVMRTVDPMIRELQEWMDDNVVSAIIAAKEKIGKARFAVYGKTVNPDATFTLRLSYGTVKGYPMNGTKAPSKTTFYGLYDRAYSFDLQEPFQLPQRYINRYDKLNLSTPLNFVSTCDIIGGNSGSPVINKNGDIVGLIFDGNIESLVGKFVYDEITNRAVAVHTAAMSEAMRKLYDAGKLVDEIEGKK